MSSFEFHEDRIVLTIPTDENNTTRRNVLRSISGLGTLGLASAEIEDVEAKSSDARKKRITGQIASNALNWVYVPFDVDEDVTELHVSYDYNKSAENLLNIGMFDPDGYDLRNNDGFRGWSGGARSEFTISRSEATPGYYPGEIEAGTWNVILGPYRVGAGGIDYAIEVTMRSGKQGPEFKPHPVPAEPVNDEPGWYRGNLHLHTVHSDGEYTPEDLWGKMPFLQDSREVTPTSSNQRTSPSI